MFRIFRVSGMSMEPSLSDGDYVVAITRWWRPRAGKLAVANHPHLGILIKRVSQCLEKSYWLTSDHPAGIDSTTIGAIPQQQMIGEVVLLIRKPTARHRKS